MNFISIIEIFNYGLVLVYGLLLSAHIAGGPNSKKEKRFIFAACLLLLVIQGVFWKFFDVDITKMLYPLIVHLPLVIILVLFLKKTFRVAFVSVFIAYLCCQLPRWVNLFVTYFLRSDLLGAISYTVSIVIFYLLLRRFFVRIAANAITYSAQNLYLFGSLPLIYYIFDYSTVIFSDALYAGIPVLIEFIPTVLIVFYVMFLASYHRQTQKRTQAELQRSMLEVELKQSGLELENLRRIDTQTAIYQHNMRHHLTAIAGFLSANKEEDALKYIKNVQDDVESISPRRFCDNELVNLLCSSFSSQAASQDVRLSVDAKLPRKLSISDTELCAVLSNGLENALHAVCEADDNNRWIEIYCAICQGKLLIEIKNPYTNEIIMQDGLPTSKQPGHGYGCRSIRSIAEKNGGLCTFEAEAGIFTMRTIFSADGTNDSQQGRFFEYI